MHPDTPADPLLDTDQAAQEVDERPRLLRAWRAVHDGPRWLCFGLVALYRRSELRRWTRAGKPLGKIGSLLRRT